MTKTTAPNLIDCLIEKFLESKSSGYTIETDKYRLDITQKDIRSTDTFEYPPIQKIIVTVRDATFVARQKELEKEKKNSSVCSDINQKGI